MNHLKARFSENSIGTKESCLDITVPTNRERNQTIKSSQMKARPFSSPTLLLVCLCLFSGRGINNMMMMVSGQSIADMLQAPGEDTPFPTTTPYPSRAPNDSAMPSDMPSLMPSFAPSAQQGGLGSDYPSLAPSNAPTTEEDAATEPTTTTPIYPNCSICDEGFAMTNPDASFEDTFMGNVTTCAEAQELGESGFYSPDQCLALQEALSNFCGCEMFVTEVPTSSPVVVNETAAPTDRVLEPTRAPVPVGPVKDVQGFIYVVLLYVAGEMPDPLVEDFEAACATFFEQALEMASPPVRDIGVELLEQTKGSLRDRRHLRRSLAEATDAHRDLQPSLPPLWTLLRVRGQVDTSTGTPPQYLNELLVEAVEQDPQGLLQLLRQIPGAAEIYFGSVDTIEGYDPNEIFPPDPPVSTESPPNGGGDSSDDDDDDGLSNAVIAAIVVGGVVALGAGAMGVYFMRKSGGTDLSVNGAPSRASAATSKQAGSSTKVAAATSPVTKKDVPEGISDDYSMPSSLLPAQSRGGDSSIAQSMPMTYTDSQHDATTQGAPSIMDTSDIGDMSYTYSLDAGNVDHQTTTSGGGQTGAGFSTLGDQSTEYSARPNLFSRQVLAPPGKLGIVIDTTLEGPVVHKVNPGSALEGKLSAGDIIVAIDDVDTRAMSASAITALMVKTANQERQLTVLSEEEIQEA